MSFLFKNNFKYIISFLFVVFCTTSYAEVSHYQVNGTHYLKVVTMQPIADDAIDTEYLDNTEKNIDVDSKTDNQDIIHNVSVNNNSSESELKCLTQSIYFEARGEGYEGGVAVGNVIMNRVKSPKFPDTVCGVMKQKTGKMCQFSFMCNGQIHKSVNTAQWRASQKIALDILNGTAPKLSKGALFFHAKYSKLRMASTRYTAKIGQHYFYK